MKYDKLVIPCPNCHQGMKNHGMEQCAFCQGTGILTRDEWELWEAGRCAHLVMQTTIRDHHMRTGNPIPALLIVSEYAWSSSVSMACAVTGSQQEQTIDQIAEASGQRTYAGIPVAVNSATDPRSIWAATRGTAPQQPAPFGDAPPKFQ